MKDFPDCKPPLFFFFFNYLHLSRAFWLITHLGVYWCRKSSELNSDQSADWPARRRKWLSVSGNNRKSLQLQRCSCSNSTPTCPPPYSSFHSVFVICLHAALVNIVALKKRLQQVKYKQNWSKMLAVMSAWRSAPCWLAGTGCRAGVASLYWVQLETFQCWKETRR